MATQTASPSERGFSLIELLEVMVITLIVTGAIYGLLSQGQHAFRREPEISDRQQQVRIAMDLIQRDLTTAGMSMPEWVQVFATGLEGVGPPNAQGLNSDFLEMIGYDGACTPASLCKTQQNPPAAPVLTYDPLGACYRFTEAPPEPMLVMTRPALGSSDLTTASIAQAESATGSSGACGNGANLTAGPPAWTSIPASRVGGANDPGDLKPVQIVRYEIAVNANGIPSLWRSTRGGRLKADVMTYVPAPTGGSDWQLVATGIEDLQVQYRNGDDGGGPPNPALAQFQDGAPAIASPPGNPPTDNDWATIVREVKVTLTARTTGQARLEGESYSVTGVSAIRGDLTSVTAPRAALFALSGGPPASPVPSLQRWY